MSGEHTHFDQTLAEHHELNDLISRLEASLGVEELDLAEISRSVEDLTTQVERHFAHEEDEGFFLQVEKRAPWFKERTDLLRQQHLEMSAALQQIFDSLQPAAAAELDAADVKERLFEFINQFREHEEEENRLLQEAFDRDVGSKD